MALFFVDEDVLYKKLECIVCPMKLAQLFLNKEMYGKIAAICGEDNLYQEFTKAKINQANKAWLCSGLNMAEHMIQIVITSFVEDSNFEQSLYDAYLDIIKVIIENKYKSVVIPYLPYSYKRLGNMYSYKSCKTLLCYFMNKYRVDCNIYILVERQVMQDHLDGYVSSYVSTSYPLSKRHSPRKYPLVNQTKLIYFLEFHGEIVYEDLINEKNFNIVSKGRFKCIYELIIEKYDGGPVGIETIAAALSEDVRTIEDVCEPYLLQAGFLQRTPRGRKVSPEGYRHLGLKLNSEQKTLFD